MLFRSDGTGNHKAATFTWSLEYEEKDLLVKASFFGKYGHDQTMITLLENSTTAILVLDLNRKGSFYPNRMGSTYEITEEREDLWHVTFRVPYDLFTSNPNSFRIAFGRNMNDNGKPVSDCTPALSAAGYRLWLGVYQPMYMFQISR